jgi:molecular chaperone GrpE
MEKDLNQSNIKNLAEEEDKNKNSGLSNDAEKENQIQTEEKSQEQKILELEDKVTRTFAEMENQRRRFEKEKEEAYEYGGFAFAKEALSLIDNLERSKQILLNDETLKNSEALKKILEHLDIINKDLISIFSKNDIKQIESLNKKLDPNFHQAMMEKEPGTIIQEIQKGFTIKDRLLRPALVAVAKKTKNDEEKDLQNKDNLEKK